MRMKPRPLVTSGVVGPVVAATVCLFLLTLLVQRRAECTAAGKVTGQVSIRKDGVLARDQSGVVVYLESLPPGVIETLPSTKRIRQLNLQFDPRMMVVVRGSTIEFPNEDRVFHNIFSLSRPAKFDLGLYQSGTSKSITFKRAGEVDIYCNIHPEMSTKVLVVDNSYFAVTRADGSFEIPNVPEGTYPLVAWQPQGAEYRQQIAVLGGRTTAVPIALVQGKAEQTHLRKDGTPYGRYK
jgi:plastocyanin